MKVLTVSIYKNSNSKADCTNNGISAHATELGIVNIDGPIGVEHCRELGIPLVWLLTDPAWGDKPYPRLVPAKPDGSGPVERWVQFGGNYAGCSDSRLRDAAGTGIMPIHDRIES